MDALSPLLGLILIILGDSFSPELASSSGETNTIHSTLMEIVVFIFPCLHTSHILRPWIDQSIRETAL